MPVKEIRDAARLNGAPGARNWNISDLLSKSRCAVKGAEGWELNDEGRRTVAVILGESKPPLESERLKAALEKVKNSEAHAFLEEAVNCYGHRLYRAAVVLSWVGALSLIYGYVVGNKLTEFNAEATRRDADWRRATNADGLARMKEATFLIVAESIGVIGKSVKLQLEGCLNLRNACGHPNTYRLGENIVAHHIETLALNVFARFA